jgi:hypothetical protein
VTVDTTPRFFDPSEKGRLAEAPRLHQHHIGGKSADDRLLGRLRGSPGTKGWPSTPSASILERVVRACFPLYFSYFFSSSSRLRGTFTGLSPL